MLKNESVKKEAANKVQCKLMFKGAYEVNHPGALKPV